MTERDASKVHARLHTSSSNSCVLMLGACIRHAFLLLALVGTVPGQRCRSPHSGRQQDLETDSTQITILPPIGADDREDFLISGKALSGGMGQAALPNIRQREHGLAHTTCLVVALAKPLSLLIWGSLFSSLVVVSQVFGQS